MNDITIDTTRKNVGLRNLEQEQQAAGLQSAVMQAAAEIAPILATGTTVTTVTDASGAGRKLGTGKPESSTAPNIEPPEGDSVEAIAADLEALVAKLSLDTSERQAEETKQRIKQLLTRIQKQHEQVLKNISESIDKAAEVAKAQKRAKIFGWIMFAVSALATIAMTVATLGSATTLGVISLVASLGALGLNLTQMILNETGSSEEKIKANAQKMLDEAKAEGRSLSYAEAMDKASSNYNTGFMIASAILGAVGLLCGVGSLFSKATGTCLIKALNKASVQTVSRIVSMGSQGVSLVGGVAGNAFSYKDAKLQKKLADLEAMALEAKKILAKIEEQLDQENTALQDLLSQIQTCLSDLAEIMAAGDNCAKEIAEQMDRMQI